MRIVTIARLCALVTLAAAPTVGAQQREQLRTIVGMQIGAPLGASAFITKVWDRGRHTWPLPEGLHVSAEVGVLGGTIALGHSWAADGGGTSVQVGGMRRWGNGSTYVGGDARAMIWLVHITGGAYVRVAGTEGWAMLPVLAAGVTF